VRREGATVTGLDSIVQKLQRGERSASMGAGDTHTTDTHRAGGREEPADGGGGTAGKRSDHCWLCPA
jgi:hypothetical protein